MARWIAALLLSVTVVGQATAVELPTLRRNWELSAGFSPVSYGFFDGLGGDGHFDTFTTVMSAGVDLSGAYRFRRYLLFGAHLEYLFSLGRTDYWSTDYEPGVHRFRFGPRVQFRVPDEVVQPFLELSGGYSALWSKNYGDSYRAPGFFGALGIGANLPFADSWGAFVRYRAVLDFCEISHMDGGGADYLEGAAVVAFLQEATVGLFLQF